jgi:pre-mRNA-processing factor 40
VNQQQQQQQPFPHGGHLQQPFTGQYNQQQHQMQIQMNQSQLQMQHQMQMQLPGMPLNQQHPPIQQHQQQPYAPNGQTPLVGPFPPQQLQMMNQQVHPPQVVSPQHTQQILTASSPVPAASAPTKDGWTEHRSPQGVPYYYNTITKVSTYERPASLSQSLPNGVAIPIADSATFSPTKASGASASTTWHTYTDQSSGKKYYSNGVTTTWTRPSELGPDESTDNSAQTTNKRLSASEDEVVKKKRRKGEKDDLSLYANKAEAIAAFKGLLLAKDIAPTTKWNDVVRMCSEDARWEACTTIGERKQALAEYQTKRANELRDVKRQEKVRAKEAYQRLLTDILPTIKTFSPGSSRFIDVRDFLSKDDRFYAVDDETTREELFYEFVEEMRKREERNKRSKKREAKDALLAFLKLKEEDGKLTFASTW